MKEKLSEKDELKLIKIFKRNEKKAETIANEPSKIQEVLKGAMHKANEFRGPLEKVWDHLQLFFNLLKDYVKGNYRNVPISTVVSIIASLTYLISPIDLIPDVITGLGLFDDIYIINLAVKQIGVELQRYKEWKTQKIETIDILE